MIKKINSKLKSTIKEIILEIDLLDDCNSTPIDAKSRNLILEVEYYYRFKVGPHGGFDKIEVYNGNSVVTTIG